jgi:hypothetical protein
MITKKITSNQLRTLIKQIIKEEYEYYWDKDGGIDNETYYEDNWEKGGGIDEEEIRNARFETETYYSRGKEMTEIILVDEEDEDLRYSNYKIVNTPKGREELRYFMSGSKEGRGAIAVYNVNINGLETKVLVYNEYSEKPEMY